MTLAERTRRAAMKPDTTTTASGNTTMPSLKGTYHHGLPPLTYHHLLAVHEVGHTAYHDDAWKYHHAPPSMMVTTMDYHLSSTTTITTPRP
jgi:hypothetical protein